MRDPKATDKLKYLNELAQKYSGSIKYFKADLLSEGSYDEAMAGCELVFHTASPFINKGKDAQRDLVNPALLGTRNVLKSVNKTSTVKRVVLTSSCAAIIGDAKDTLTYANHTATEENWNTTTTLHHQPYSYSKTVAEAEAWKIAKAQSRWDLVVINPSLVIGPGIHPKPTSESFSLVKQLGDGSLKTGAPGMEIGAVDVRDLGKAHFRAGFTPQAEGRHIFSAQTVSFLQLGQMLRNHYGNSYPFPKSELPKWMVWLMAPAVVGVSRKMVANNMGYPRKVDYSKSLKALQMKYTPVEKSIVDFFNQMIESGAFKKK